MFGQIVAQLSAKSVDVGVIDGRERQAVRRGIPLAAGTRLGINWGQFIKLNAIRFIVNATTSCTVVLSVSRVPNYFPSCC